MRALILLALLSLPNFLLAQSLFYTVEFEGVGDAATLKAIKSASQLVAWKKRPPDSVNALRYRAESDREEILKVLHAHGYYEASIEMQISEEGEEARVLILVHPGPVYTLEGYSATGTDVLQIEKLGISLGKRVLAKEILNAELKILQILSESGYPLARIMGRETIADGQKKCVRIRLDLDLGPLCHFGKVRVQGLTHVREEFILGKIAWKEGEVYNQELVEKTQETLLDTGLFSSILITHVQEEDGGLLMKIDVTESKHKSIEIGASYQTVFGPGASFGWENRNVAGLGRKLSVQADATRISHSGIALYHVPNFYTPHQELVIQAQAMYESITAYSERSYNLAGRLERKFGVSYRASLGAKAEELLVRQSVQNGNFSLVQIPLYFRWSSADSLLNPTSGATLQYIAYPAINITRGSQPYFYEEVIWSDYLSLTRSKKVVLAQKISVGSILSRRLSAVPVPERFLGGSEEELRGYKYKTVSPLADHHKPIGGRSAIYYSLEMRFRLSPTIGLVPFLDMGNVYLTPFPKWTGKWRKSLGLGARYFTFFGPLRFDIGFPLNPRKKLDSKYQLFVSIGQMF